MGERTARPRPLRWHLIQMLLLGVLPVGLLAAALLTLHWRDQLEEHGRVQMETTRLLAAAIDNELDASIERLEIFGRLVSSPKQKPDELYWHAKSAVWSNPDWMLLLAAFPDGRVLFRTDVAPGKPLPAVGERRYFRVALEERRPVISEVFQSGVSGEKVVDIAVPWLQDGKVARVLIARLNPRWLDALLNRQGLPPGGIGGIFDAGLKFVARSHDGDARRGASPAPGLHEDMLREEQGIGRYPSLDNTEVYTTWSRTRHGWWVALAAPAAPIEAPFWRYLFLLGALLAALVAAGLAFATWKGRRIGDSLELLGERARSLGRGVPLAAAPRSEVLEVQQALHALQGASELLEKARRERDELLNDAERGRSAAEEANRAKDEFLAMLAHELRNPLAAVSNAAAILRVHGRTPEQRDFATSVIHRQAAHLKRLIDDLLDVGRVMTGKILLERRPLELASSVRHLVETLRTAGVLASHRLETRLAPAWVSADHTRIEQIVTNLIVNAATYTPEGGEIRLALAEEQGQAALRVSDSGIGIPPEYLARVFELFFQGKPARERPHGGLGIGLTLVKRLVELHGGTIHVESDGAGRGATFTVRLPLAPAQVDEVGASARAA